MWKKGQSGNPGGEEKIKLFRRALRDCLSLEEAKEIARAVIKKAKAGDLMAVNVIADRLDGKPEQSLDIRDERGTDLAGRFEEILARAGEKAASAHAGEREGGTGRVN